MDSLNRCYRYSIIDGNLGIEGHVGTFKVYNMSNGNCVVEWSFEAHPSKYYGEEEFIRFVSCRLEEIIQGLAETSTSEEYA